MEELQRAIENLTQHCLKFPKEELELICANKNAAIPYLRDAVEKAVREKDQLDSNNNLHFYAIYLLAQFQDREFFPTMIQFASLPEETLDFLIGDVLTEDLGDILYHMYNGNLDLLKQTILNKQVSDFARAEMLDVMGQLYLDHTLETQQLQDFLREIVYDKEDIGDYIYSAVAELICDCHFADMLPEIRRLYSDMRVDEYAIGGYDECIDELFTYRKHRERFCKPSIDAGEELKRWPIYGDSYKEREAENEKENRLDKVLNNMMHELGKGSREHQRVSVKIGRNDPCPCGSGKKYKQCCLKKAQLTTEGIESEQERAKWLEDYPKMDAQREEGRVYLEDLYSSESIELDQLLYLALKHRVIPIGQREPQDVVNRRKRRYLTEAFYKFQEIVEREKIQNFSEYDSKYSIHYFCTEWLGELIDLLKEEDKEGILEDVASLCKNMGIK